MREAIAVLFGLPAGLALELAFRFFLASRAPTEVDTGSRALGKTRGPEELRAIAGVCLTIAGVLTAFVVLSPLRSDSRALAWFAACLVVTLSAPMSYTRVKETSAVVARRR